MSNKVDRQGKETKSLFADPKTARQAWRSVGAAILQSPAIKLPTDFDQDGGVKLDSAIENYSYDSLAKDIQTLTRGNRKEPTELEMIFRCQILHARHNPTSATFVRDTVGAKPVDESKMAVTDVNPYDELTDEELEALAEFRAKQEELRLSQSPDAAPDPSLCKAALDDANDDPNAVVPGDDK